MRAPLVSKVRPKREPDGPMLGVFRLDHACGKRAEAGEIVAADRRIGVPWRVPPGFCGGAEAGELVEVQPLSRRWPAGSSRGPHPVRVIDRLGRFGGIDSLNRIVIRSLELAEEFAPEALAEAAAAGSVASAGREDLRSLPLVTIDGADAKDFDDAIFAAPEDDGFRVIVAIADVSHYVRAGSALDHAAFERGNSVYLPGRVLPMLPPALSEHWCSLRPGAERGVLFAEILVDSEGRKRRHRFARGIIRSAARLTYEAVQHAAEHRDDLGLAPGTLGHLYAAWGALMRERTRRAPLEIELPERKIVCDPAGLVSGIVAEPRLASHRLVEDFMILANVAAAEEMRAKDLPGLYRMHAAPAAEKIAGLRSFLAELGVRLPTTRAIRPGDLSAGLARLAGSPAAEVAAEKVLQSLPEAGYAAANGGHFGLALASYAHFTSPIRRYADLTVHRALASTLHSGTNGPQSEVGRPLGELALYLGIAERRAVEAERGVLARAAAALNAARIGSIGEGRISGVTRSMIFVKLQESGADGVVPVSTLPRDRWHFNRENASLAGALNGQRFAVGERVRVRLVSACAASGRIELRMADGSERRLDYGRGKQRRSR